MVHISHCDVLIVPLHFLDVSRLQRQHFDEAFVVIAVHDLVFKVDRDDSQIPHVVLAFLLRIEQTVRDLYQRVVVRLRLRVWTRILGQKTAYIAREQSDQRSALNSMFGMHFQHL